MTTTPAATTSILVTGMTCGHCVASVTEEITALPGVLDVHVALKPGEASTVTILSSDPLTHESIAAAVDEAGYALA